MRKLVFAVLAVLLFAPGFSAGFNGIEAGDNHIFLFGGKAFQGGQNSYKYDGGLELSYGWPDLTGGLQWLNYVNPYIGFGLEFAAVNYTDKKDFLGMVSPGVFAEMYSEGTRFNLMLLLKVNVNPRDRVRLYPVFGLGANYFHNKVSVVVTPPGSRERFTETSITPAGYAGLGFEADITEIITIGIEGRYNAYMIARKEGTNNSFVTEMSAVAKIGFRF